MAKAIIPVLKDFKQQINNTNYRLYRQYRMMMRAHDRYNILFRQTRKTFQIHHLALLMIKDYITILVGTLQRIHRQYIRYESALDDTLIGIVVLLHCGCLSLNPFIEFRIWNNSSSSDVLNVQASISISPIQRQQVTVIYCCMTAQMLQYSIY